MFAHLASIPPGQRPPVIDWTKWVTFGRKVAHQAADRGCQKSPSILHIVGDILGGSRHVRDLPNILRRIPIEICAAGRRKGSQRKNEMRTPDVTVEFWRPTRKEPRARKRSIAIRV